jgi:hypothetical protein
MTKRQRTPAARGLRGDVFPALRAFLKGYLHQDFTAVHGSVRAAAEAFRADASEDERDQLVRELETLVETVSKQKTRSIGGFITDGMGSGWMPTSREEILELLEALRG